LEELWCARGLSEVEHGCVIEREFAVDSQERGSK
jgi:hypothetical protein